MTASDREGMPDPVCVTGCQRFYGGEVLHHKHCPYYPESLTKLRDAELDAAYQAVRELAEATEKCWSESIDIHEGRRILPKHTAPYASLVELHGALEEHAATIAKARQRK